MIRQSAIAIVFSTIFVTTNAFSAIPAPGSAKFDFNRNGIIDKGVELEVYLRHKTSPILGEFDANLNGKIDAAEAELINKKILDSSALIASRTDAEDQLGSDPGFVVTAGAPDVASERLPDQSGILIRKSYEPVSAFTLPGQFESAGGALISYKHDITDGNDSASANGVVAFYKHWNINTDYQGDFRATHATRAGAHAGIEFDQKLDQKNPSAEVDILTARAGGEIELSGGLFDAQYFRASVFDTTSTEFESHLGGGEIEWEPVYLDAGIGVARRIGNLPVSYRWRPIAHGEFQSVLDSGGDPALSSRSDSYLFGPIVTAELWVEEGLLNGLYIDSSYRYLWDAGSENDDVEYFDIGASFNLDEAGHFAITTRYRAGETPKGREDVEDITIGLGIKF